MVAVRGLVEGLLHEGVGAMGRGRGLRHGGRAGRAGTARYSCRGAKARAALLERLSQPIIAARLLLAPRWARELASPLPPALRPSAQSRAHVRCVHLSRDFPQDPTLYLRHTRKHSSIIRTSYWDYRVKRSFRFIFYFRCHPFLRIYITFS